MYAEPGPDPVIVDGEYDSGTQLWVPSHQTPQARSNIETSQPTQQTTNQSTNAGGDFVPDSYDDANRDFNQD
jgi:hypothetical protein